MGWSWEYIENEVTIPILRDIYEGWRTRPPVHRILAAYFGFDKEEEKPVEYTSEEEVLRLFDKHFKR